MATIAFKMPAKPKVLTEEEVDFLEVHFYLVWPKQGLGSADLYDFVSQESEAFVRQNKGIPLNLVQREFLRLARMEC